MKKLPCLLTFTVTVCLFCSALQPDAGLGHPFLIVGPVPQRVTDAGAMIWWMSPCGANVALRYGTARGNPDRASVPQALATASAATGECGQQVALSNLQPDTTYYYQIVSKSDLRISGQFRTEAGDFRENQRVWTTNGPVIEYLDDASMIVAWSTNVSSASLVRYGTDPNNLDKVAIAPWGQETHRVTLRDLKADTPYYFVVESGEAQGTGSMAKSNLARFSTVKHGDPAIKGN